MRKTLVSILYWLAEKGTEHKTPDWIKACALLFLALIIGMAYAIKSRFIPVAFFALAQNLHTVV